MRRFSKITSLITVAALSVSHIAIATSSSAQGIDTSNIAQQALNNQGTGSREFLREIGGIGNDIKLQSFHLIRKRIGNAAEEIDKLDFQMRQAANTCTQESYDDLWKNRANRIMALASYVDSSARRLDEIYQSVYADWSANGRVVNKALGLIAGAKAAVGLGPGEEVSSDEYGAALQAAYTYFKNIDDTSDFARTIFKDRERFLAGYRDDIKDFGKYLQTNRREIASYFNDIKSRIEKHSLPGQVFDSNCGDQNGYCPINYTANSKQLFDQIAIFTRRQILPDYSYGTSLRMAHQDASEYDFTQDSDRFASSEEDARQAEVRRLSKSITELVKELGLSEEKFKHSSYFENPFDDELSDGEGVDVKKLASKVLKMSPRAQERFLGYLQTLSDNTDSTRAALLKKEAKAKGWDSAADFENGEVSPTAMAEAVSDANRNFWSENPLDSEVPIQPKINLSFDGEDDDLGLNTGRALYPLMGPLRSFRTLNEDLQRELRAQALEERSRQVNEILKRNSDIISDKTNEAIQPFLKKTKWMADAARAEDEDNRQKREQSRKWLQDAILGEGANGDMSPELLREKMEQLRERQNSQISNNSKNELSVSERLNWLENQPLGASTLEDEEKDAVLREVYEAAFPGQTFEEVMQEINREYDAILESANESINSILSSDKETREEVKSSSVKDAKDKIRQAKQVLDDHQKRAVTIKTKFDSNLGDGIANIASVHDRTAKFDAGPRECKLPDVVVIDVTKREGFGCTTMNFRGPGNFLGGIGFSLDSVYFDNSRGKIIKPFNSNDILGLCVSHNDGKVKMVRDEQGRIVVVGMDVATTYWDTKFKYSNGYRSDFGDALAEGWDQIDSILSGNADEMFAPILEPPKIEREIPMIDHGGGTVIIGPNSGN